MIEWLMGEGIILGLIKAPRFAWLAAGVLMIFTLAQLMRLCWLVHRECRIHQDTMRKLEAIKIEHAISPREGLSGSAYEAIAKAFEETPPLLPA
jgi:hypothetical protein